MPELPELSLGPVTLGQPFWEALSAVGVVLLFALLAWAAHAVLGRVADRLGRRPRTRLWQQLINAVTGSLLLLILVQGLFLGATLFSALEPVRSQLRDAWSVAFIALVAVALARLTGAGLTWYARRTPAQARVILDRKLVPPFRRTVTIAIYLLAGMLILDQLNISISPLIAGLGIGGLAVALALQPTLGNFFAGTYLVSDNVISPGDFIELESGLRGYVVEVGWRSTRIRTPFNNLVVIPNSRLSDSILTNYHGPTMDIGVMVEVGVSYSSDLEHVQRVALEVASQVIKDLPEANKDFEPWFGYERFGDSNIDLWVWVQATDRIASFALKTELIKGLHKRFREEGIEINYPVRRLLFPPTDGPAPSLPSQSRPRRSRSSRPSE